MPYVKTKDCKESASAVIIYNRCDYVNRKFSRYDRGNRRPSIRVEQGYGIQDQHTSQQRFSTPAIIYRKKNLRNKMLTIATKTELSRN